MMGYPSADHQLIPHLLWFQKEEEKRVPRGFFVLRRFFFLLSC